MTHQLLLSGVLLVLLQAAALAQTAEAPTPHNYCKPCLFYAGDWGPKDSDHSGMANEDDGLIPFAAAYVPFDVPKTQQWKATGVFTTISPLWT
jgi:hypothetical protein